MDDLLVAPWERLVKSRAEMAREEGISVRTLQRRLAAGRDEVRRRGFDDIPWVEITGRAQAGDHYRTDDDHLSVLPGGIFLIGTATGHGLQLARSGDGHKVEQPQESKHKFKPKARKKRAR